LKAESDSFKQSWVKGKNKKLEQLREKNASLIQDLNPNLVLFYQLGLKEEGPQNEDLNMKLWVNNFAYEAANELLIQDDDPNDEFVLIANLPKFDFSANLCSPEALKVQQRSQKLFVEDFCPEEGSP